MISFKLNGVPTLFIKGFTSGDIETMLNFAREANAHNLTTNTTILFIDTPITAPTVEAVHKLKDEGFRVVFRDHHGIDGEPTNDRDRQVFMASAKLEQLLGDDCTITVRREHPACSTLVSVGEFADALAVIADPAELALVAKLAEWPRLVEAAADTNEPHRVAFYLYDLASEFHALWNKGNANPDLRFLQEDNPATTRGKLALIEAVAIVISNGLGILGVTPVDKM